VTPGVRLGQWLAVLLPLVTAVGLALRLVTYRRERRPALEPAPAEPVLTGPDEKASRD